MIPDAPRIVRRRDDAHSITRDCDCACSDSVPIIQKHQAYRADADWILSPNLKINRLNKENYVAYVPSGGGASDGIAVINESAKLMLTTISERKAWKDESSKWQKQWGKTVNNVLSDFVKIGFLLHPRLLPVTTTETPYILAAWLHITDRCNLRCSYCYFPHKRVDMSLSTGYSAIDAIFRSAKKHGYQQVKIKYAGGEPLIRFPIVTQLHKYALDLSKEFQIKLEGVILTNGTLLTIDVARIIKALGLRLMISLDGLHDGHDYQRPYADGRASSIKVKGAIQTAVSTGVTPDISITVTGNSVVFLPELIEWVISTDLPFSLNFYRENNYSLSYPDLQLEEEKIIQGMLVAYKIIENNLPRQSLLAALVDRANLATPHRRTCAVGHSYLVFNHSGRVAKCQMLIDDVVTDSSDPDPLYTVRRDTKSILNLSVQHKEGCNTCEWQNWCAGGCPLSTYRATGRYDIHSPNCNIYKALFPEVVRLEGLRLLKYEMG